MLSKFSSLSIASLLILDDEVINSIIENMNSINETALLLDGHSTCSSTIH